MSVGWVSAGDLGRQDDVTNAGDGVDLVVIAVPDHSIAAVADAITPTDAVVIHLSGSRPLSDLDTHDRVGSLHPLVSLPDPETGAARMLAGAVFAVAGDPLVADLVAAFGGRAVAVSDENRTLYHATAAVAANHLVALCAQVERLAEVVGVPAEAYWALMSGALENVSEQGAARALTGPAARADWRTIADHLAALPSEERALYEVLSRRAAELAGRMWMGGIDQPDEGES